MSKIILSGDWHFGRDNDSRQHNEYLLDFVDFMINYAKANDIGNVYQLGDFFDNRSKVSVETLNYAIESAKRIADADLSLYVLTGNHDMFYKNRLDVSSTRCLGEHATIIADSVVHHYGETDIIVTPWVCDGEQWDTLVSASKNVDYVFGHFEFRNFMMNENYVMEHGLSHRELKHCKRVITGHYHKRQEKDNVIYVGSPFPFDYNDANDLERGFLVLDTETDEIEWVDWCKVKIFSLSYDEFLEFKEEGLIDEHTSVRINVPDDADESVIEEASKHVSELTSHSKINYKGNKAKELMDAVVDVEAVDNIDQSIVESIRGITEPPSDVSVDRLIEIYESCLGDNSED